MDKSINAGYYDEFDLPALNSFDGQGLISPEYAEKLSAVLGLRHKACQFVIRAPWIKGMVCSFRFKDCFKRHGITQLQDVYGAAHNVDDLDMLISASQFKAWRQYRKMGGWKYYSDKMKELNLLWGICSANKAVEDD